MSPETKESFFGEDTERLVKRVQRTEVKGYPIGLDAYTLNPYRLLDCPASTPVSEMNKRFRKLKLYRQSGRGRQPYRTLSFGKEFRLTDDDIQSFYDKIANPRARLTYGTFWIDFPPYEPAETGT